MIADIDRLKIRYPDQRFQYTSSGSTIRCEDAWYISVTPDQTVCAQWVCAYCMSYQKPDSTHCCNCGAPHKAA